MGLSNYIPSSRIAQSGVCTSTTRPATPYEGQMIYETDTNRVLVYDNTAWVMIADTDQPPGLQLIKTQTIGSAVTEQIVSDAFTSDYDNYHLVISDIDVSTSGNLYFQFRDGSGSNIGTSFYAASGFYQLGSTTLNGLWGTTGTFWELMPMSTGNGNSTSFDLLLPNKAEFTRGHGFGGMAEAVAFQYEGLHRIATAYPSFRIYVPSGTMTGGTVRVYGYRN